MGQTARKAQRGRADERDARLEKARRRRLELDLDREARDARVDAAVADVYQAQDERQASVRAIVAVTSRVPTLTSGPSSASRPARACPTMPVPRTAIFISGCSSNVYGEAFTPPETRLRTGLYTMQAVSDSRYLHH